MNYSKQREVVLEILENSFDHPTVEEIFVQARKKLPSISLGTIYRNLTELESQGKVKKIVLESGKPKFDFVREPHSHAYCKVCGKLFDFKTSLSFEKLKIEAKRQLDFDVTCNGLNIVGICKDCKQREGEN